MTIKELYGLCDNLGPSTLFEIRTGYPDKPTLIDASYMDLGEYYETPVKGFMLSGRTCTIYI